MAFERIAVQSRDLSVVGYEKETQTLEVAFKQGGVYIYRDVPTDVYEALMKADSHGIYFNEKIKNQYPTEKIH